MESYEGYTSERNKMTKQNITSGGKKSRGKELISGTEENHNNNTQSEQLEAVSK